MPVTYSSQYRQMVLAQVRAGRSVYDLAEHLEVSAATIFRWKKKDQIDVGTVAGLSSQDSAELRAARARIAELEAELATLKRASELFVEGRVVHPKELFSIVEQLGVEGHGLKSACRILKIASSGFSMWRVQAELADTFDHVANQQADSRNHARAGHQRTTETA